MAVTSVSFLRSLELSHEGTAVPGCHNNPHGTGVEKQGWERRMTPALCLIKCQQQTTHKISVNHRKLAMKVGERTFGGTEHSSAGISLAPGPSKDTGSVHRELNFMPGLNFAAPV